MVVAQDVGSALAKGGTDALREDAGCGPPGSDGGGSARFVVDEWLLLRDWRRGWMSEPGKAAARIERAMKGGLPCVRKKENGY